MRATLLVCLLAVAAGLIATGAAILSVAAGFVVAGVEVAAISVFALADLPAES